ncbi:MAG: hypothetical protein R3B06_14290 [Kofleriaceae bacterium]
MITRFCFVRLQPTDADAAGRAAAVDVVRSLAALPGLTVAIDLPADATAAKWDLAITVNAPSLAHLAEAMATPAWAAVDAYVAGHAVVVKAWNFART